MPGIEDGIWCYMCGFEAVEQEQMDRHMKNTHASSSNLTAEQSYLTAEEDTKVDIIEENTDTNVGQVVEPVKTT